MASQQQTTPPMQFDMSPAESFVSTPGESYSSLFAATTPSATANTMNPMEMMTPMSFSDERRLSLVPEESVDLDDMADDATPGSDKKPAKKRKSWGQVLPEPKTNLPPRKRAKTEDEKEQRRVERVLRNRRAAQSSRERKRLEVEALEHRNKELETMLISAQKANLMLVEELNRFRRNSGVVTRSSSPLDSLRDNPVTLSQELFSSQDGHRATPETSGNSLIDDLLMSSNPTNPSDSQTVNPASLSPELGPVPDEDEQESEDATVAPEARSTEQNLAASDLTQHPAVSHVGEDATVVPGLADLDATRLGPFSATQDDAAFSLSDAFSMPAALDADRYVLESGLLSSPNSSTLDDDYLAGDHTGGLPAFDPFDINDFLNDDSNYVASDVMAASNNAAADHGLDLSVFDSETQVPSENPNQQPQSGASTYGCDDGGIAVGV